MGEDNRCIEHFLCGTEATSSDSNNQSASFRGTEAASSTTCQGSASFQRTVVPSGGTVYCITPFHGTEAILLGTGFLDSRAPSSAAPTLLFVC